jgi:hypothetical protein
VLLSGYAAEQPIARLVRVFYWLATLAVITLSLCTLNSSSAAGAIKNIGLTSLPENIARTRAGLLKPGAFTTTKLIPGALNTKPETLTKRLQSVTGEPTTL